MLRSCGSLLVAIALVTACDDATHAPAPGSLQVSAMTTGVDPDPDGYLVAVDGDTPRALSSNGSITLSGVPVGTRAVRLDGVATNCTAGDGVNRRVNVAEGQLTPLTFAINCAARVGAITVSVNATGAQFPTSGFDVGIDDDAAAGSIAVNGTLTQIGIREGQHAIWLRDLAANCAVLGPNPQMVTVAFGQTANVAFSVSCFATGIIRIKTTTAGPDLDADGYTVRVTRGSSVIADTSISVDGTVDVSVSLSAPKSYLVSLVGVAPNCMMDGEGSVRLVSFDESTVKEVSFAVECEPVTGKRLPPGTQLAFVRDGRIYRINSDGTGEFRLTDGPNDSNPAWSPDGRRIAFIRAQSREAWSDGDIYVMDADGSNVIRRTRIGYAIDLSWSPDGKRIAFTCLPGTGSAAVCVVSASDDTSGPIVLTDRPGYDAQPAWSPDGRKIAFVSDYRFYDFVYDVYVMNADGSDVTAFLEGAFLADSVTYYFQPAWSPDGRKLAVTVCTPTFTFCDGSSIAVMDLDGFSGLTTLANAGGFAKPVWSPDGKTIAFSTAGAIRWIRADGSDKGIIVPEGHSPSWRP